MSEPKQPTTVPSVDDIVMRWVPIEDALPEINRRVLFCCLDEDGVNFSDVELGWYEGVKTLGEAIAMETVHDDKSWWFPCTHWMPLPDVPQSA